jgi:predicted permease
MTNLFAEVKYGVRALVRDKVFTLTVLVTLAVCMAANSATLAMVSSVLLRPLPVPDSHEILLMSNRYPGAGAGDSTNSDVAGYFDRRRGVTAFGEQALYQGGRATLSADGAPEQVDVLRVTPSFFPLIRIYPALGRAFTEAEGEIGAEQKVILTHATWQRLFGGAPDAVGKSLRLSGRPYEVVGVMPRGFVFNNPDVRLIIPLAFTAQQKAAYHTNSWHHIGRLKPGASIEQAQAQVDAVKQSIVEKIPEIKEMLGNSGFHTSVEPLQEVMVRDVQGILYLLWGGALFVLLIGALNVANLALVRFTLREKEVATRLALGASRGQLLHQFVTENVLLTLAGATAGLGIGAAVLRGLVLMGGDRLPRAHEIRFDALSIAASLGLALLLGLALGCLPMLGALRANLVAALHDSARSATRGAGALNVRRGLVVAQVGFAFVLLLGAGLLLTSFRNLLNVDPGFRGEQVLTAATSAPRAKYADGPALVPLMERLLASIRQLPGVKSAGATSSIPFGGDYSDSLILAEGYLGQKGESPVSPYNIQVTPGYFETMGITLLRGRYFDERDKADALPVVIVDERLARKFWGESDPLGRRMFRPESPEDLIRPVPKARWLTVVGVVRSVRQEGLADFGGKAGAYYFPYAQRADRGFTFAARIEGDAAAAAPSLRAAMAKVDPDLALFDIRTMNERTELSLSSRRTSLTLATAFGGLAVFLCAIGIYSVLAYHVTQRHREFGIRMALGSTVGEIVRLVLREAVLLATLGLVLGVAGSGLLRTLLENQVYGVRPLDPLVMTAAFSAVAAVVFLAAALPARRATRVDPLAALRCE